MKTRKQKRNRSPQRPFPRANAYVIMQGELLTTRGLRGRTEVKRIKDADGKRVKSARLVASVVQPAAPKAVGDRKPKKVFVGRVYTGVARSKPYPYRSVKRGAPEPVKVDGLFTGLAKRAKRVITKGA